MNKQTTTILGVGALAVVGYLVYQQMSKPKSFANFSMAMAPLVKCQRSPNTSVGGQDNTGRDIYACCRPGTYAYAPSQVKCDGSTTSGTKANQFTVVQNPTSNF